MLRLRTFIDSAQWIQVKVHLVEVNLHQADEASSANTNLPLYSDYLSGAELAQPGEGHHPPVQNLHKPGIIHGFTF
jgi:hypothetical protein